MMFARVSPYLKSDMDRHGVTTALGEGRIFAALHEAIAAARAAAPGLATKPAGSVDTNENDSGRERQVD
jgi:hypothetical protein